MRALDQRVDPIDEFRRWQSDAVAAARFECTPIRFSESKEWRFEDGVLRHQSGGFFSLAGVEASARGSDLDGHQQLIILQPQIAINGFLLQERAGRPHLLFYGRIEPGNVGGMQLAPTVQSTPTNYRRLHLGRCTPFVDFFLDQRRGEIILDTLQSEEGSRFHGKYNRNVVVRLPPDMDLETPPQFRWHDIEAIGTFAHADNVLNTDARSVLSCLDWQILGGGDEVFADTRKGDFAAELRRSYLATDDQQELTNTRVFEWISHLRARLGLRTRIIPISHLVNWTTDDRAIREREQRLGFAARPFRVVAHGREVDEWDQPLIDSRGIGRLALVCQRRGETLKFLVKASREVGFLEGVQLAPSISIPPGQHGGGGDRVEAALIECVADSSRCEVVHRCRQSEEGGRFFRDENDYELIRLHDGVSLPLSDAYRWMTLAQIRQLARVSGIFSMECRGALSLLLGYA
jgi:oxidase EvaA